MSVGVCQETNSIFLHKPPGLAFHKKLPSQATPSVTLADVGSLATELRSPSESGEGARRVLLDLLANPAFDHDQLLSMKAAALLVERTCLGSLSP